MPPIKNEPVDHVSHGHTKAKMARCWLDLREKASARRSQASRGEQKDRVGSSSESPSIPMKEESKHRMDITDAGSQSVKRLVKGKEVDTTGAEKGKLNEMESMEITNTRCRRVALAGGAEEGSSSRREAMDRVGVVSEKKNPKGKEISRCEPAGSSSGVTEKKNPKGKEVSRCELVGSSSGVTEKKNLKGKEVSRCEPAGSSSGVTEKKNSKGKEVSRCEPAGSGGYRGTTKSQEQKPNQSRNAQAPDTIGSNQPRRRRTHGDNGRLSSNLKTSNELSRCRTHDDQGSSGYPLETSKDLLRYRIHAKEDSSYLLKIGLDFQDIPSLAGIYIGTETEEEKLHGTLRGYLRRFVGR